MALTTTNQILSREVLVRMRADLALAGRSLITANGCFDLLHPGHEFFLTEAKTQGDVLLVFVNTDEYIRSSKGAGRPVDPLLTRMSKLLRLACVDHVTVQSEDTPETLIRLLAPDVHVEGEEYGENPPEAAACREVGARLHFVRRLSGHSTTQLLEGSFGAAKDADPPEAPA